MRCEGTAEVGEATVTAAPGQLACRHRPLAAADDVDDGCSSCCDDITLMVSAPEVAGIVDTVRPRVMPPLVHSTANLSPVNSCCCCCCCCCNSADVTAASENTINTPAASAPSTTAAISSSAPVTFSLPINRQHDSIRLVYVK